MKSPINSEMEKQSNELAVVANESKAVAAKQVSLFTDVEAFETAQRVAKLLASADFVPAQFRGNLPNTVIALEYAQRTGSSPLAVMQSMYIVHGRPSWSAQFIIACINACGRFSPLRFRLTGEGDELTCVATAIELATGEELASPPVSIKMAKAEGWVSKSGSKWQTMPELMLRYRAATFFGRLYAADVLMGMHTEDEVRDIDDGSATIIVDDEIKPAETMANKMADKARTAISRVKRAEMPQILNENQNSCIDIGQTENAQKTAPKTLNDIIGE